MPNSTLYSLPECYDIAFNYRDIPQEVDFLESVFRKYSGSKINKILDIACGTCPHSIEFAKRGRQVSGLDLSKDMLIYAKGQKEKLGLEINFYRRNMRKFTLNETYDASICMCASLQYLLTNEDYCSHLNSVANALQNHGLYVVELDNPRQWFIRSITDEILFNEWSAKKDGKKVHVKLYKSPMNYLRGTYELRIILDAKDRNGKRKIVSKHTHRILLPQEFRSIVDSEGSFELLDYYGDFDLKQPLDNTEKSWKMIGILKKK